MGRGRGRRRKKRQGGWVGKLQEVHSYLSIRLGTGILVGSAGKIHANAVRG